MNDRPVPLRPDVGALDRDEARSLRRAIAAIALAGIRKTNPEATLKAAWPSDTRAQILLRSAVSPTSTSDIPGAIAIAPFRSLAPSSAALALFARGTQLSLVGVAQLAIPSVSGEPQAVFVGEGQPIGVADAGLSASLLGPLRKVAILATLSSELEVAVGPESASQIIGRILDAAIARSLDAIVFGDAAATDLAPAGLLHGATEVSAGDDMAGDVGELIGGVADRGVDVGNIVLIAAPRQSVALKFAAGPQFDLPILVGSGFDDGLLVACAPIGLTSSIAAPRVETSRAAVVHHANPAAPIDGGSPIYSVFQQSLLALRLVSAAAWVAQPGSIAFMHVNWGRAAAASAGGRHHVRR
jgi:hypothetical protein